MRTIARPMLMKKWSIACWPARILASSGSISPDLRRATDSSTIRIARPPILSRLRGSAFNETSRTTGSNSMAACDEVEPENPQALTATGYLAAGVHSTQITANTAEKDRYDEMDDMAATLGTSMLGLTVGCARCHDHKFDPIPTADYYRLISTFTTTVRSEAELDLDPAGNKRHGLRQGARRSSRH